jgi:hypothetical protein
MRTLLIKGRLLLPAAVVALLFALALGGTASAWGGGDRDEAKGVAEHTGSVDDNGKDRAHGDIDREQGDTEDGDNDHGDNDHENGDKDDNGAEHGDNDHGDNDHENGDKDDSDREHGDNDHGDDDHENGDKDHNGADHGDNDHDNGDKDDNDHGDKDEDQEGPGKDVTGPGGQAGAGGQVVAQVTPVAPVPAQVSPAAGNEAAPEGAGQGEVLGQGGEAGPELAQVQGEEQPATGAAQQQPAQLASTGANVLPLLVLGALCVAASILLLRRRTTV